MNRDDQDQDCTFCTGERETIEHFIVECRKYEEERHRLISSVVEVIGEEEWNRRVEEEEGGITTILGLYRDKEEAKKIVPCVKTFLVKSWKKRSN